MNLQKNSIVTYDFKTSASNTCELDSVEEHTVLLTHPLARGILLRVSKDQINTVSANGKDSIERSLDFANANSFMLDHSTKLDLYSLGIFFFISRKFTSRQKHTLANICGILAMAKFNDDLKSAMSCISKNLGILDEFNLMWFNNFKGLFSGKQPVTSNKQRSAIFNIAGYVLAELETPSIPK